MNKYFPLHTIKIIIITNKPLNEKDYREGFKEYTYQINISEYNNYKEDNKKSLILKLWKLSRDKHKIMNILNIRSDIPAIKAIAEKTLKDEEFKFRLHFSKEIKIQTYFDDWDGKIKAIWGEMKKQDKINFKYWINSRII
jgi:hypothetical protein